MRRDRASREDAAERPPPVKRGDKSGGAAEKESMFALKKKPDEVSDGSLVRMLREGLEDSSSDEEREDEEGGKEEEGQEAAPNGPKLKMRPNVARKNSSAARKQERGKIASAAQGAHQDTAGGKSVKKMTLTEEEAAMNGAPGTSVARPRGCGVRVCVRCSSRVYCTTLQFSVVVPLNT